MNKTTTDLRPQRPSVTTRIVFTVALDENKYSSASPNERTSFHHLESSVPVITSGQLFGPKKTWAYCGTCRKNVKTKVVKQTPGASCLASTLLCLIGCGYCVALYCIWQCKNRYSNHYCSSCEAYLGTYDPPTE